MADDLKKRGRPDRYFINTHEQWEMDYWKKDLGVSGQQLAAAIKQVGNGVAAVRQYLNAKK